MRALLDEAGGFRVTDTAATATDLVAALGSGTDVVLVHEDLGPLAVMDLVRDLGVREPLVGVVVVVRDGSPEVLRAAMESGARGIVTLPLSLEELQPPPCEVESRRTDDGGSVRLAFVKLGRDYSFARSELADGETRLTFIDGSEVALVAGAGGKLELQAGGRTYGGRLAADGELGVGVAGGDTWVFDTPEEADEFEDWIPREKNEDRRGDLLPADGRSTGWWSG